MLANKRAALNRRDKFGQAALTWAVIGGNFNFFSSIKQSEMMFYFCTGYDQVVNILIDNEADLNIRNDDELTPLITAIIKSNLYG